MEDEAVLDTLKAMERVSVCLSICVFVHLSVHLFIYLYICQRTAEADRNMEDEAMLDTLKAMERVGVCLSFVCLSEFFFWRTTSRQIVT